MVNYTYVKKEPLSHDIEITTLEFDAFNETIRGFNSATVVGHLNSTFNGTIIVKLTPKESIESDFKLKVI